MRESTNIHPLGAIIRDLDLQVGVKRYRSRSKSRVVGIYRQFDEDYGHRADYRLWRQLLRPHLPGRGFRPVSVCPQIPEAWEDWTVTMDECVGSAEAVVLWSSIALAPELVRARFRNASASSPICEFMDGLFERLTAGLLPLSTCPASCGLAAVSFLIRHQNMSFKAGHRLSLGECEDYFCELEKWFRVVDSNWRPGNHLGLSKSAKERHGPHRLRDGHDAEEFATLSTTLSTLRPTLSYAITELTPRSERLLESAFLYGLTAWRTARARRINEYRAQAKRNASGRPRDASRDASSRFDAFRVEFKCHLDLANAARDAGRYLETAKILYLLYRLVPDEFADSELVKFELERRRGTFRYLKEAGLEVDARFEMDTSSVENREVIERKEPRRSKLWDDARTRAATIHVTDGARTGRSPPGSVKADEAMGFLLRVERDFDTLPEWHAITNELAPGQTETAAGFLLTIMKGLADASYPASAATLAAAFSLALRYGYVRSASKILARGVRFGEFTVTSTQMLAFVQAVKQCTQLDPFGARQEWIVDWRELIKQGCQTLQSELGEGWVGPSDRLAIHETIVNPTHAHHRTLRFEQARRLYEKAIGNYNVEELREFYLRNYDFDRKTPGIANVDAIQRFCAKHTFSPIGAPVAVSLMTLKHAVSVVAVGCQGVAATDVPAPNLADSIQNLVDESVHWFQFVGTHAPEHEIGWPAEFHQLARSVLKMAHECDPGARVLLVSMDSELAHLPWQHLFRQVLGADAPLVAVVPSFSGFLLADRPDPVADLKTVLSDETGVELDRIARAINDTTRHLDMTGASVCIVAGHGLPPEKGKLPGVRMGSTARIESLGDWMDVLGARIVILHCCHSGVAHPLFMEEFGGVPGLANCLGTETFLAPVAEVHSRAAVVLQRNLFAEPGAPIGQGYLSSITDDPECCLYALYGNPYERVSPLSENVRPVEGPLMSLVAAL